MKILITGISGFVGSYLTEELLGNDNQDIEIHGTYINEGELSGIDHLREKVSLHKCDICQPDEVAEVIESVSPDQIYHLAGIASPADSDRAKVFAVNVSGTLNIIKACQKLNKPVRVLLASTGYVYGSADNQQPFTEKSEIKAAGVYAESKLEMEQQAMKLKPKNVGIVISRSFNHIGPRQTPAFVAPAFAKQIAEIEAEIIEPIIKVGNLEAVREFFDVRDAVKAYKLLIEKGRLGEIYNVASGEAVKISDLLDKLLTLSSKQ